MVDLAHRPLPALAGGVGIAVDHPGLGDHRVLGRGDDAHRLDVEMREPARAFVPVREGGVNSPERDPVDDEVDVGIEHLAPDLDVTIVVRLVIARHQRCETCRRARASLRPSVTARQA
jgi:hypothetical protein